MQIWLFWVDASTKREIRFPCSKTSSIPAHTDVVPVDLVIDLDDENYQESTPYQPTLVPTSNEAASIFTPDEIKERDDALLSIIWENASDPQIQVERQRITDEITPYLTEILLAERLVKSVKIQRFGSYLSGTESYDSDIDLHLGVEYHHIVSPQRRHDTCLLRRLRLIVNNANVPLLEAGQLIQTSRLCLWKTTHIKSRLPIDVVFNNPNGIKTARCLKKLISKSPAAYSLIQLFKLVLKRNHLISGEKQLLTSYSASILTLIYLKHNPPTKSLFLNLFQLIAFYSQPGIFETTLDLEEDELADTDGTTYIICPYERRNLAPHLKSATIVSQLQRILKRLRSKKSPF
jgi:predicted nucleotidyltransferase